jgi:HSP20 family protein
MNNNIIKRNGSSNPLPATTWVDQLLQENLDHFFNHDFPGFGLGRRSNSTVPVNLRETDKTYEMEIMVPGLKKEDLKLQATNDMLTISYEQKQENETSNEGWIRKEYGFQSFSRSFSLDDTVDVTKIAAEYTNGVLRLTLPKKEHAQKISKNIEIK